MPLPDGQYAGVFTQKSALKNFSAKVKIVLKNGDYQILPEPSSGQISVYPVGQGEYHISSEKVKFEDKGIYLMIIDGSLIVSGDYQYEFDGHNLQLRKSSPDNSTVNQFVLAKM